MIDLILFIYSFLPGVFVHILLVLGCIGYLLSSTPLIIPSKVVLKYTSIFIIALSLFLEGSLAVNNEYKDRVKEWNHKVEIAEVKANEANSRVEYIYQDRIQKVKEVQVVIQERIRDISVNIDKDCKVSKDVVSILNDSAKRR